MRVISFVLPALFTAAAPAHTLLIQAERLQFPGGWQLSGSFMTTGAVPSPLPMAGAVRLPAAGKWRLWVRARDFAEDRPGIRNFTVRVGNKTSAVVFGKHGRAGNEGWAWEDGGVFELPAGPLLIVVGERSTTFARCDALILSDEERFRPPEAAAWLRLPEAPPVDLTPRRISKETSLVPPPITRISEEVASLRSAALRLAFHRAATAEGEAVVLRVTAGSETVWSDAESYRVLYRPPEKAPRLAAHSVHPTWDTSLAPQVELAAGAASVRTASGSPFAPWASGMVYPLRPARARQVDAATVDLEFAPLPVGQFHARWRLPPGGADATVHMRFAAAKAGHVSLGYHGAVAEPADKLDFVLLPPMYHGRRLPPHAMLLSAVTPAPLALVNRRGLSCALVAEPEDLPTDWPSAHNSRYAFGLKNEVGQAQPMLYAPVLGLPGSTVTATSEVSARFRVVIRPGAWYEAYKHVALDLFRLRDHRRAVFGSLSDAALNLYDLIRGGTGWDARAKGPWNIEARNTVTHSSPLTYLSVYLLTGDADFYTRYARPALEYLLSRATPHFAAASPHGTSYYRGQSLGGPAHPYGAAVLSSALAMTHGRTPAFGELSLVGGEPRPVGANNHSRPFSDALALWKLTGERRWLDQAVAGAGRYIAENLRQLPTRDLGPQPFINVSFIPAWEDLLHVYEATGERRFLDAAAEGARWLLTTLWLHPLTPEGNRTIHPGGRYVHARTVWYLGDKRFRLGAYDEERFSRATPIPLPETRLPERSVPAWQVENAGLGLEQPVTYVRAGNHANILMSIWAPNLLRLAVLTGDGLFRTAARNATIGRFTNYPGYYVDGFTDEYQRPDYPVKGPDVTTLYYHHVPPFLAYVLDYLFTDAEVRSRGAIRFPFVRQNGYVWFDSRLYGHAPGMIYGHKAWPWLHRTAAAVDNIQVDRILAHDNSRFFVILMNQSGEPQSTTVRLDPRALGRPVDALAARVWLDGRESGTVPVRAGAVRVTVGAFGLAVLRIDGTAIRVPTHGTEPPAKIALTSTPVIERKTVPGSKYEAVGIHLSVPPFTRRDLYVYVASPAEGCAGARLIYRAGNGLEQQSVVDHYPCEFTVSLPEPAAGVAWRVEMTAR